MTEKEWLVCADPTPMLEFLLDKTSDRKLRLFAVACCRRVQDGMGWEISDLAITAVERNADNQLTLSPLSAIHADIEEGYPPDDSGCQTAYSITLPNAGESAFETATWACRTAFNDGCGMTEDVFWERINPTEQAAQAYLTREIVLVQGGPLPIGGIGRTSKKVVTTSC